MTEQKPALNLKQTLKKIKEAGRLSNQREKLIGTIDNLEGFEILQKDEAEETNLHHFQRCELKITDDNSNVFALKILLLLIRWLKASKVYVLKN